MRLPPYSAPKGWGSTSASRSARLSLRVPPWPMLAPGVPVLVPPSSRSLCTSATTPFSRTCAIRASQVWDADDAPGGAGGPKTKSNVIPRTRKKLGPTLAHEGSTPHRRVPHTMDTGSQTVHWFGRGSTAGRSGRASRSATVLSEPSFAPPRSRGPPGWDGEGGSLATKGAAPADRAWRAHRGRRPGGYDSVMEKSTWDEVDEAMPGNTSSTWKPASIPRTITLDRPSCGARTSWAGSSQKHGFQPPANPPPTSRHNVGHKSQRSPKLADAIDWLRSPKPTAPQQASTTRLRTDIESLAAQQDVINRFVLDIFGDDGALADGTSKDPSLQVDKPSLLRSSLQEQRRRELDKALAEVELEGRIVSLTAAEGSNTGAGSEQRLWGKELIETVDKVLVQLNDHAALQDVKVRKSLEEQVIALLPLVERTYATGPAGHTVPVITHSLVLEAFVRLRRTAKPLSEFPYLVQYEEGEANKAREHRAETRQWDFDRPDGIRYFGQLFHSALQQDLVLGKHSLSLLIEGFALYPDADAGEERALGELISMTNTPVPLSTGGQGRAPSGRLCGVGQAYSLLLGAIARDQTPTSSVVYNTLVQAAIRTGEVKIALKVFELMEGTLVEPAVETCLSILPLVPVQAPEKIPDSHPTCLATSQSETDLAACHQLVQKAYEHILRLSMVPSVTKTEAVKGYLLYLLSKGDVIRAGQTIQPQLATISATLAAALPSSGLNSGSNEHGQELFREFVWGLLCCHDFVHAFDWIEAYSCSSLGVTSDAGRWITRMLQSMLVHFQQHPGQANPWLAQRVEGLIPSVIKADKVAGEHLINTVLGNRTTELERLVGTTLEDLLKQTGPTKPLELLPSSVVRTQQAREHIYATRHLAQELREHGWLSLPLLSKLVPLAAALTALGDLGGAIDLWTFIAEARLQAHGGDGTRNEKLLSELRLLRGRLCKEAKSSAGSVLAAQHARALCAAKDLLPSPRSRGAP